MLTCQTKDASMSPSCWVLDVDADTDADRERAERALCRERETLSFHSSLLTNCSPDFDRAVTPTLAVSSLREIMIMPSEPVPRIRGSQFKRV